MVLDAYREKADLLLLPLAKRMRNVSPNLLTILAFLSAIAAGVCLTQAGLLFVLSGLIFVILNALLDALDGRVAKLVGKESKKGDFLDHTLDRYADLFILGGIMFGPYCNVLIGFFAILGVLLTSYMGTQAEALGVGRVYAGILGRATRLVMLMLVIIFQAIAVWAGWSVIGFEGYGLTPLEYLMLLFAILGNVTAMQRGFITWSKL